MTRRRAGWAIVTAALWLLASGVSAQVPQPVGPGRGAGGDGPHRLIPADDRPGRGLRDSEARERMHRLSPEERRQLRRDVHEAGRDLYPGRMAPERRPAGRE
ncbi:MAG: hypothetical protein NDI67_16085 [Sulfuritalea sp.]|nr:hypothetical protein [Sulfuritalea sp.]